MKQQKKIIKIAKSIFMEKMDSITLFGVTDEPYMMFNIKFIVYNYFVLQFNYDRGHFGCNIVFGEDSNYYFTLTYSLF